MQGNKLILQVMLLQKILPMTKDESYIKRNPRNLTLSGKWLQIDGKWHYVNSTLPEVLP